MNDEKWNVFLKLMRNALWLAEKSNDCSFDDPDTGRKEDKCSALSYAAACMAKYSAAEAIYWTSPEIMQFDLSGLFAQFDIFTHEVQSDYEVDHSRQWVDIHFERLKELYEDSVCNQSEFG